MIEELTKIGEINSVNDFFDFKLSIKTIIILAIVGGLFAAIAVVFMLGGVNNTIDYANSIIETTKNKVILKSKGKVKENKIDDMVKVDNSVPT